MKKLFVLAGILVFLILSCSTSTGTVFNDTVPVEQSAWIAPNIGKITSYNGIAVEWKQASLKLVQIPAGVAILEWDINSSPLYRNAIEYFTGKNLLVAYNFLPQKKYFFYIAIQDDKYGLNIYAYDPDENLKFGWKELEAHFVAFAPFLNIMGANEETVLE